MAIDRAAQTPGAAADAVELAQLGAAQPAARGQQRHRLEQVGLARAVLAVQHDRAGAGPQHEMAVVAKVPELEPPDRQHARPAAAAAPGLPGQR